MILEWFRLSKKKPPLHLSVLVRMELVGPVYDVAVFAGRQPDGELRWILGDVRLDYRLITHWALIEEPDETNTDIVDLWTTRCQ